MGVEQELLLGLVASSAMVILILVALPLVTMSMYSCDFLEMWKFTRGTLDSHSFSSHL